ncbi:hypothetical protein EZI45_15330 [Delftia tsuruhatensis]|uniref:hypothetical protein n=1 Tax=Delftia tsuruhatensis TaxID=180282 RepID=UPI001056309F|nr:hypothetical protein [Delftia tsuruhatensis]TDF27664.1 hypothetical protein EZI45_15330 [Delftia tsuruhatensis]
MFKKILAAATLLGCGLAHAFMPSNGTWVVTSELNGKPGRGLAIDAQNGTLVMQMYAYEPSGQPTFYMTSGALTNNRFAAPLIRYKGGRFLGSGPMSGSEDRNMGQVSMRFTSGVSGFITLPGEQEVAISRFNFGYPAVASSLRGIWTMTSIGSEGLQTLGVELTRQTSATSNGNGLMTSGDGLFGCEHQIRGPMAGETLCVWINGSGQVQRSYRFVYSVNDGEGTSSTYGNRPNQRLVVKRLTTPQDVGTGIVYENSAPAEPVYTALHEHIENLSFNAAPLPAEQE